MILVEELSFDLGEVVSHTHLVEEVEWEVVALADDEV